MRHIFLGSDHAGYGLKSSINNYLSKDHYKILDCGTYDESSVDYPDFAYKTLEEVIKYENGVGILICGSGIGMSIAANRHPKIRAALCHNELLAQLSREHNDANVLVLGARYLSSNDAFNIIDKFLNTPFAGGRHENRVLKLSCNFL